MIRGFLFDLGGTLFDFGGAKEEDLFRMGARESYEFLRREVGLETDYRTYHRTVTRLFLTRWIKAIVTGRELSPPRLFHRVGLRLGFTGDPDFWRGLERSWEGPARRHIRLIQGAEDLLAALRNRGLRLGVVSNVMWRRDLCLEQLDALGIRSFFDTFTFSSEVGYRKPHRRIYVDALGKLGLRPREVCFVGNYLREDVRGPERLGMRAVLLERKRARMRLATPRHRARSLTEVRSMALRWCGR
jgi:putative hydrolase of the HAD superfamily